MLHQVHTSSSSFKKSLYHSHGDNSHIMNYSIRSLCTFFLRIHHRSAYGKFAPSIDHRYEVAFHLWHFEYKSRTTFSDNAKCNKPVLYCTNKSYMYRTLRSSKCKVAQYCNNTYATKHIGKNLNQNITDYRYVHVHM